VIKEASKEKHYRVDAEYPQIEGDARFDKLNREARSLVTKDLAAFKTAETSEPASPTMSWPTKRENRAWISVIRSLRDRRSGQCGVH